LRQAGVVCVAALVDQLLTPNQAAQLRAVKASWICEAVRTHRLPCLRIGRHIRFTESCVASKIVMSSKT
jgi:excisionase family DNA binding protein